MTSLSTQVNDPTDGAALADLQVWLHRSELGRPAVLLGQARTDHRGRIERWTTGDLSPGHYRLTFEVAAWFTDRRRPCAFDQVVLAVPVAPAQHRLVPLLVGPTAYATYRPS